MGQFINGQWSADWYQPDIKGRFVRPPTQFRQQVSSDGTTPFKEEKDRYHLYVSLACPWAHRVIITRKLRKLEDVISLSIVDPLMGAEGWEFSNNQGCIPDTVSRCKYLRDVYLLADPRYTGRVTVPVLWDKQRQTIVNNESLEIMRMLDTQFEEFAESGVQFYPDDLQPRIDAMIQENYQSINNGVYRCGFAASQEAYDEAVYELQRGLERCEKVLSRSRYLCGEVITEADWCLFTSLIRFDLVYYTHFKCNFSHIYEYKNLGDYVKELYQYPGVDETCNFEHIKDHYFKSHKQINPSGIVPKGPKVNFNSPHYRNLIYTPETVENEKV